MSADELATTSVCGRKVVVSVWAHPRVSNVEEERAGLVRRGKTIKRSRWSNADDRHGHTSSGARAKLCKRLATQPTYIIREKRFQDVTISVKLTLASANFFSHLAALRYAKTTRYVFVGRWTTRARMLEHEWW